MHVPKLPLVDVVSQIVGAEGPAGGGEAGSCSSALQAEMKHFEHEALGDEEEGPARNNVQNKPVMGEPTSASACRPQPMPTLEA